MDGDQDRRRKYQGHDAEQDQPTGGAGDDTNPRGNERRGGKAREGQLIDAGNAEEALRHRYTPSWRWSYTAPGITSRIY